MRWLRCSMWFDGWEFVFGVMGLIVVYKVVFLFCELMVFGVGVIVCLFEYVW